MNLLKRLETQREFFNGILKNTDPNDLRQNSHDLFELFQGFNVMRSKIMTWRNEGSKTFVLSKDLIEAFLYTDIPMDLTPLDFQYPFESFMIEGQVPLFNTNTPGGPKPVHSILFLDKNAVLRGDPELIEYDGKVSKELRWDVALTAFFPAEEVGIENIMMHMRNNETIKYSVETRKPGRLIFALDERDARNTVNLFYNTVLYINDTSRNHKETSEYRERQFKERKGGKFIESNYILLKPPNSYNPIGLGEGKKLDKRFVVRGHWKSQAYGEQMKLRKKIWIKPYWKGPEISTVISKPYKVV